MAGQANSRDVVPRPDGSWAVTRPGGRRALYTASTQAEAVQRAGELLQRDGGGELRIHGVDGQVRDQRTIAPGNDPVPPRG
ncbi:DUF2188 domain-containing protein [Nonomuraea sp. KC401]|uniref:DUF2188 domain-containing protein n=1 Tax=unclassified Nonomuraea TaxID=2593643 RepID=UPI0010FD631E|nr:MULTISPECIES: DUF2188 domain-containing protein [unclassified Nonomuraea]NBE98439.1 DUF2188 domain-containing protein [Nonomuraea sp. K271]TLF60992.1 DUF2188 domain-containing protein [Nonomuraea sp. KC401]